MTRTHTHWNSPSIPLVPAIPSSIRTVSDCPGTVLPCVSLLSGCTWMLSAIDVMPVTESGHRNFRQCQMETPRKGIWIVQRWHSIWVALRFGLLMWISQWANAVWKNGAPYCLLNSSKVTPRTAGCLLRCRAWSSSRPGGSHSHGSEGLGEPWCRHLMYCVWWRTFFLHSSQIIICENSSLWFVAP